MEDTEESPAVDSRLDFICDYVLKTLKLKQGKWEKLLFSEENRRVVQEFLDRVENRTLVVSVTTAGLLQPSTTFMASRNKAVYFVKRSGATLNPDLMTEQLVYGEICPAVLNQFSTVVQQVVVPVLSNTNNQSEWTQSLSQDMGRHVHALRTSMFVLAGQVQGKTLLALPAVAEGIAALGKDQRVEVDKSIIYSLESTVIEWIPQIHRILRKDSCEVLLERRKPMPQTELLFWKNRLLDLECIHSQLKSSKVDKMIMLLEAVESSYCPAFDNMKQHVFAALEEARDICRYLRPLQPLFADLENTEFPDVKAQIRPLMHMVCLVWANSQYYNSPARIIVLLQATCNLFIQQARLYLVPEEILRGEVSESLLKVQTSLEILELFRTIYEDRRANLNNYQKNGASVRPWNFSTLLVFSGLNQFMDRVKSIKDILLTALDMMKLEKLEVGGLRGRALSLHILQLQQVFMEVYKVFAEKHYDCLDLDNKQFENDLTEFKCKVDDTECQLGTIFCQAFEDAASLEHAFKVLDMFGSLLERPLVAACALNQYPRLIAMFDKELDCCKVIFDRHVQTLEDLGWPLVNKNMPAVAGGLNWVQELQQRIQTPFSKFRHLYYPCLETPDGVRVLQKYEVLMQWLDRYCAELYTTWTESVSESSQYNLGLPLIIRDSVTRLISVNFNQELASVLREVKYLQFRQTETIPVTAMQIYTTRGQLWQYVTNLAMAVGRYNKVIDSVLDVEKPLVQGQIRDIDVHLKKAEESLKWNSEDIWPYIQEVRDSVSDLESRLQRTKDNVEEMQSYMRSWVTPVFERKDGRKDALLSLEDRAERLNKFYGVICSSGEKIHVLLKQNLQLFRAEHDSEEWKAYVEYIDDMVIDGLFNSIECSLRFFLNNTDQRPFVAPLFEAQLDLKVPHLVFTPPLDFGAGDSFFELVETLINDVFRISSLVPRVAQHSTFPHYQADMEDMADLADMRQLLMGRVKDAMASCCQFRNFLECYSYLYVDDRKEFMWDFLLNGHVSQEMDDFSHDCMSESLPTLDKFKEQVDHYEKIYDEVQGLEPIHIVLGWLRVDGHAVKIALLNIIKKWSFMFKQHLINHVTKSLSDLEKFIIVVEAGLSQTVEEGNYTSLVEVMGHLLAVKERQNATDTMFEPLQHTIALLKVYEQELPDVVYKQLEELPERWNSVRKQAAVVKQKVAPLQATEVVSLRRKCTAFDVEQCTFRVNFRNHGPFRFDSKSPHQMLDEFHQQIQEREAVMASLVESASLFEVTVSEYKQLQQCRHDVVLLKELWDMITMVESSIAAWSTTPWREINVEDMELQCKQFAKDIKVLDKEVRAWEAFTGLDSKVRNLLTSLRAITELQNPAIRDRHWHQLMAATGVHFTMDKEISLADLLQLNLHCFEEDVKGIVDKAVKEMGMEKVLSELNSTWRGRQFQYELHHRTQVPLLCMDEELMEILEDNQVQLQNLISSKYVAHFLDEVSSWQNRLSVVDTVISIWFEVQRTWTHLESIFIGSEDIRSQMPEDTKRFEGIDADFKVLAYAAYQTPNVVESTITPGLFSKLEGIQSRLSLCEKALREYLDTKRLAFPRFYFVSSADLLDILSNGTNPQQVQKHLSKLFDNIAEMRFETDEEGNPSKTGLGMYSKEEEYVPFSHCCECTGQVEVWLTRLLDTMRSTVRDEMTEAVLAYEDKPREQWLFDYPAQVALTCTQIWWTSDVNIAFTRMEEGYDNALKEYYRKQVSQLNTLISMLIGQLTQGDRQKIMTICTIDVHARDIIAKMIAQKVENSQAFLWLSQLRHRWDDKKKHCFANICDAQFLYSYEYLGNTPRLVITPLTDRCYITLTQSLHLTMSGAPAGPAGTGKTETTKDLGRALGIMVYVFNCSEQMDYKSCGNIYKGLAQTGAWGCFDEFNRISVEVLSVVAVQVKSIQDAIRDKKKRFNFLGEDVNLCPSVGIFITMNPGYAGRTELPENLKALFRPCAMVVPDFELICEIMLVAEGFINARALARKFITLYTLCKELLSKQDHYDWGLRAIKSVLVVAGSLKREDPGREEDQVLMRALRDFNIPKIITDDMPVFMGLIGDLFPALDVARKRDQEFEKHVRESILELKLQAEDNFVLKVVQLEELLAIRHSVFVIGNAGTGKSEVMRSLQRTYQNMKRKPVWADLNPKAVTNDELFGIINPATREWKDGLFSNIMRELANISHSGPKWIVLDGDIDPMWIESLNTVMDDNKVLTLASNERIPLNPTMRLVFEISHLCTATPATVSRAGILYINPGDLGWNPPVSSWIDRREVQSEKANLIILFDKYLPVCLDTLRTRFKKIIPIPEQSMVQMLCYLLECLLTPENTPPDCAKEVYELYFVFAAVWAFGGALFQDQLIDCRMQFSKWWVTEFKAIKFPSQGTVFDYYIDPESKKFEPWSKMVPRFEIDADIPLQVCLVHTTETIRIRYFMDRLLERQRPLMLVGNAGTGKSVLVGEKLGSMDTEKYVLKNVPFNYYTTSAMLQAMLEKPLEKKAGRNYGPPGSKRLIYFLDDMNMPEVDAYGTVQPHTLIRQHMDYSHWYDRNKILLKEVHNVQYVSCMNPTAGSFTINPRLQRHFSVFALSFPGVEALTTIYTSILSQHLKGEGFMAALHNSCPKLVQLALAVHQQVSSTFLPTAIKFHYIFNLRDLSNIFQGILFCTSECLKAPADLLKIYLHESNRVYRDKLVEEKDFQLFDKLQRDTVKKLYEDVEETLAQTRQMNVYCHFTHGLGEARYMPAESWSSLNRTLLEMLDNYNEVNATLNLVLFEDAMAHVCHINRILESPRGNALLVGVGGSGKQSLARLAAFISSLDVFQITLRKGYSVSDLKMDLASLYIKAGMKNIGTMFLMTDAQVADEKFLVLVNDLLASGEIPDMFPDEEVEHIIGSVMPEVCALGLMDTKENCWKFFIDRVRRQLKVALCFSPVGNKLRDRSRKFPAVVNCTAIDWFHEWPQEALESVSFKFLQKVENIEPQMKESFSKFMAYVHMSVNDKSKEYLANERRYNYTTPKSFLEQIKLYCSLLGQKSKDLSNKMERLQNGLTKLNSTSAQVDDLKAKLAAQEVNLKQKNKDADKLIQVVGIETEKMSKEKFVADEEERKVAAIAVVVSGKQRDCEEDLAKAEPALLAAQDALNTLNKWNKFHSHIIKVLRRVAKTGFQATLLEEGHDFSVCSPLCHHLGGEVLKDCHGALQISQVGPPLAGFTEDPLFGLVVVESDDDRPWSLALFRFWGQGSVSTVQYRWFRQCLLTQQLGRSRAFNRFRKSYNTDIVAAAATLESDLTKEQNGFKITLKTLEDNLLSHLSAASGNFLGDNELVENLEITKHTAAEIEEKVKEAKVTEVKINEAREHYRPAAAQASLLYFIMNDLNKIHPMYQFSLKAFSVVFQKAVLKAEPDEDLKQRVLNLIESITSSVFQYTTRGLFECDKLTYIAQLAFQILMINKDINTAELDFLLRYPVQPGATSPVVFLSNHSWGGIKALCSMEQFKDLDRDIEGSAKCWKKFVECECPEKEKFPQEWKNKTSLQKLCMMRVLRSDRMTYAVRDFVEEKLGSKYVIGRTLDFAVSFEESGPATPMFFILSPGVDPLKDVEKHGKKLGFTFDNNNFHNVSLGQGQEIIAEQTLELAAKKGHWVILQNIHLVASWLGTLEKRLEQHAEASHENFRVFVSAEPSSTPEGHKIPQGILENSIKITNEPPTGMHANLHKALDNFSQNTLEMCARENEFKGIWFALCYFHAVVAERRKFGPQGWNRSYPFNTGDLTISINVLYNYLEANLKVPFDDLRYLFGEIMYGGHITDDWDRRLCRTYLEEYIKPEMMEEELYLAPGFPLPGNMDYNSYHQVRTTLEEILEKLPYEFNIGELLGKAEEKTPYKVVALQECERMNILTQEIRRSLQELSLGLKGELTMTSGMESLQNAVFLDMVPDSWNMRAYPSMSGLTMWFIDLLARIRELDTWSSDFLLPSAVWLAGFFNPQSFLTAIMQTMARRNKWPLDSMCLQCDVTKKNREDFSVAPREGAYVHGLYMEGARWDTQSCMIVEARLKDLTPAMPVLFIRAIPIDKQDNKNMYQCPVYKTRQRGPTYVWTFNLKTKEKASKWTLAGVAMLLQS
eukprot:XP_011617094.1 PREDICTED: dynein heavy chain 9, axonemal [Takifugu rubripes]